MRVNILKTLDCTWNYSVKRVDQDYIFHIPQNCRFYSWNSQSVALRAVLLVRTVAEQIFMSLVEGRARCLTLASSCNITGTLIISTFDRISALDK